MQLSLGLAASRMRVVILGSGSGGNVVVVESGGRRLMVDAGFSCREIESRLRRAGIDGDRFAGLILTHEHTDHVRGAARFAVRHSLPVYATQGTFEELPFNGGPTQTLVLQSGRPVEVGEFVVEPFAVPHDAREPIGVVIEDRRGHRLGLVADLGTRSRLAWTRLTGLDALILETNHDLKMLRDGPYPWPLKQRVAGRHGHLSNREASEGIAELEAKRLQWVALYHLSRTNNLPVLAMDAVGEALSREGSTAEIFVSNQFEPTPWLEVSGT